MEAEIADSLKERARELRLTQTGVKCSSEGCVFFIAAKSAGEMFETGWQYHNEFDKWLRARHWNEWLEIHSRKNGDRSSLAWRVVGLRTKPFVNWYVVTKKQ
jgi:hypothetical protein